MGHQNTNINIMCNLLAMILLCYILRDRTLVNGQAYHFSKGWMPGKRNFETPPSDTDQDGYDTDADNDNDVAIGSATQRHSLLGDAWEGDFGTLRDLTMIHDATENDVNSEDSRLRTLLRTLPRIERRRPAALLTRGGHSRTSSSSQSPQCQVRPHLTRLIQILLDKEARRLAGRTGCAAETFRVRDVRTWISGALEGTSHEQED